MAFGPTEIWIIVIVIVVLFGATTIPKLARSLGRVQGEFKKAKSEFDREVKQGEAEADGPSDAKVRQTAEDLGISTDGKSVDQLKAEITEKLS